MGAAARRTPTVEGTFSGTVGRGNTSGGTDMLSVTDGAFRADPPE